MFRIDFISIDWLDLLAVQGTLKRLLEHHNSKTSVLQCSAFCMVQLHISYMTNVLDRQTGQANVLDYD